MYRFPNLIELDLSKNTIKTLPARLTTNLPKLERLSLLYNALTNDSLFFAANKHLKALNIQGNQLTILPVSIRKNRRIESLWAGNNGLKTVDFRGLRRLSSYSKVILYFVPTPAKISSKAVRRLVGVKKSNGFSQWYLMAPATRLLPEALDSI